MVKIIKPAARFSGTVRVPPDKSLTHRSILFSALAKGISTIENPLEAEDCLSTAFCMEQLGCRIEKKKDRWTVHGVGLWGFSAPTKPLNCGNSGTTMRLLSGILAAQPFETILEGDASLSRRPMDRVAAPLRAMGVEVGLKDGKFAPMKIKGNKNLKATHWKNKVASAQVKSCVLLAGLHAQGETSFEEPALSRDHTERMLASCGVKVRREQFRAIVEGPAVLKAQNWKISGDISSAAFFLVAGSIVPAAHLMLEAVNINPTRTGILDVLAQAGARIEIKNRREVSGEPVADLVVSYQSELHAFSIDQRLAPRLIDEIPVLAVLAACARGKTVMTGLEELRVKETDRIAAIAQNLSAMGVVVKELEDGLEIEGSSGLQAAKVSSFDDHRIAMAFAVAGLVAKGETTIEGSEAVSISYPQFWDDLSRLSTSR